MLGRCGENMLMLRVSLCDAGEKLTNSHNSCVLLG